MTAKAHRNGRTLRAMARAENVDEYLEGFDGAVRERLDAVRELIREAAPDTTEVIKWGQPAWLHRSGTILLMLSGHARHLRVAFTPSTRAAFDDELADYDPGKGSVRILPPQEVPRDLLRRIISYRIREHEDDGVLWM